MARMFPLAGLLRLRQVQEEQAASDLAVANARAREIRSRQSRARDLLGASGAEAASSTVLYAVAAARASSRSMLAELDALDGEHQPVLDQANEAFAEARARSIGLEKLAGRHQVKQTEEELHAEQAAIDEMASTGWHRNKDGKTP
ncbi:flagellar export protein FliJ [Homoserinimonas sp. A447]